MSSAVPEPEREPDDAESEEQVPSPSMDFDMSQLARRISSVQEDDALLQRLETLLLLLGQGLVPCFVLVHAPLQRRPR